MSESIGGENLREGRGAIDLSFDEQANRAEKARTDQAQAGIEAGHYPLASFTDFDSLEAYLRTLPSEHVNKYLTFIDESAKENGSWYAQEMYTKMNLDEKLAAYRSIYSGQNDRGQDLVKGYELSLYNLSDRGRAGEYMLCVTFLTYGEDDPRYFPAQRIQQDTQGAIVAVEGHTLH